MGTQITTSTAATATAYSNQRKIDRTSNGVLWALYPTSWGGNWTFACSIDNGTTWTVDSGSNLYTGDQTNQINASFFIDQDDYAHHVYKNGTDGYIYYRRGTPNAARTAWTWSAATLVRNGNSLDYPDVIVHREGAGWSVHVVSSTTSYAYYHRLVVGSSGDVTVAESLTALSAIQSNSVFKYPSIDFNHTGDGKTVAGGTPHLYVAWSAGATGAGKGIRFKKATYSGGVWTWGAEREIDSTRYVQNADQWVNCLFDGTRVVIAGQVFSTTRDLVVYERDAADTTTTVRASTTNLASLDCLFWGSATYDELGNIYLFGANGDGAGSRIMGYRKWTRATSVLGARVTLDSTAGSYPYVSTKRGYSNSLVEYIYTDGIGSPYSIVYDTILLNTAPTVSVVAPADNTQFDPRLPLTVSWNYSDADGDPQTQYQIQRRDVGGTWIGATIASSGNYYTIAANSFTDETDVEVRVRVYDGKTWSDYDTISLRSDSWIYLAEDVSAVAAKNIDATGLDLVPYEAEVRTADAVDYGPWSDPVLVEGEQTLVWTGTQWAYIGTVQGYDTAWEGNRMNVHDGTAFKPTKVR